MARIIKKICLIIVALFAVISIKAYANELSLDCQDSINPETENTLEYTLKGNFTDNVNSIKVRYRFSEGVEFKGFTPAEGWNLEQGGTPDTTGLVLRIENVNVNGEVEFGKFTLNVPSSYNKKTVTLTIYGLDGTNTNCAIIDFEEETVSKQVTNVQGEEEEQNNEQNNENNGENNNNENNNENNNNNINNNEKTVIEDNNPGNTDQTSYAKKEHKEDKTVAKTPFGQFGEKSFWVLGIILVGLTYRYFKKTRKYKRIK